MQDRRRVNKRSKISKRICFSKHCIYFVLCSTDVPILSVVTKGDSLEKATISNLDLRQYDLGLKREQRFGKAKHFGGIPPCGERPVHVLDCYRCEIDHVTDLPATQINPSVTRDSDFLRVWREILVRTAKVEMPAEMRAESRRRAVSETSGIMSSLNSCIPSFRLRINSYS